MVMKMKKPMKPGMGTLKNTDKKETLPNDVKTKKDMGKPIGKMIAKKKK